MLSGPLPRQLEYFSSSVLKILAISGLSGPTRRACFLIETCDILHNFIFSLDAVRVSISSRTQTPALRVPPHVCWGPTTSTPPSGCSLICSPRPQTPGAGQKCAPGASCVHGIWMSCMIWVEENNHFVISFGPKWINDLYEKLNDLLIHWSCRECSTSSRCNRLRRR